MPRIRSIHYDACKSDKLDHATAEAERCYWRLAPHCDDEGRAEDDPRLLRSAMFPISETITSGDVDVWLKELDALGLVVRYEVDGRRYLAVARWADYQKPQKKVDSRLPPPPECSGSTTRPLPEGDGTGIGGVEHGVGVGVGDGDRRKRRPSSDFVATDEHRTYADSHGLNLEAEREHWVLDCEAKNRTYSKLNAGFATWLRQAVNFGRGSPPVATLEELAEPLTPACLLCHGSGLMQVGTWDDGKPQYEDCECRK